MCELAFCLSTLGREKVPRRFGPPLLGTKPKDLLQFDYIEPVPSNSDDKYVLILRDEISDYKWLSCFPNTNAENAAHDIINWCAANGVPGDFMSDEPMNFKIETFRLVSKGLKTRTTSLSPTVPRAMVQLND